MGSLMSGWGCPTNPAPLSVEEELKKQHPLLGRRSTDGHLLAPSKSPDHFEEKHALLVKVAQKQDKADRPFLQRRSLDAPNLNRKSATIKAHIKGQRGSTVTMEIEPRSPAHPLSGGEEGEEDEAPLGMTKDKWWRKLSSSALNTLDREPDEDTSGPSSYVPQFDLSGEDPYKKDEAFKVGDQTEE